MRLCTEFTAVGKCVDALAKKYVNYTCFDFFRLQALMNLCLSQDQV